MNAHAHTNAPASARTRRSPARRSPALRVLAAALAAALAAGCTSPAERAIEEAAPGTDVDVDRSGDRITIEDDDGSATIDIGGELPDRIAAAFAVPADFVVDVTSEIADGSTTLVSVAGHLERADLATLTAELTSAITAAGWTIGMTSGISEEVQLIAASRADDDLQVSMTAAPGSSRFDVVITLSVDSP